ncbi:hypothetical protein [Marinobacter sp. MDS2]|uniref:hypothetical protein n=1 Tax=Marinobacter sp. MDS2 TaxID=3065961 RepID=UPI00273B483F|nr:hypothetical protein [Marinobacter sp. MDS2]MDP4546503.1 hypothetical protein [Marinobacter sp. MDS2]
MNAVEPARGIGNDSILSIARDFAMTPDFTQPRPGWRRTVVNGEVLYLPRGISYVNNLWRVTVYNKQEYQKTLTGAWRNLNRRRNGDLSIPPTARGPQKRIDTGVIGVWIQIDRLKGESYAVLKVTMAWGSGSRAAWLGSRKLERLTQDWLDRTLCRAIGFRWYVLHLKRQDQFHAPIRPKDLPDEWVPETPVRRVLTDEVFALEERRA